MPCIFSIYISTCKISSFKLDLTLLQESCTHNALPQARSSQAAVNMCSLKEHSVGSAGPGAPATQLFGAEASGSRKQTGRCPPKPPAPPRRLAPSPGLLFPLPPGGRVCGVHRCGAKARETGTGTAEAPGRRRRGSHTYSAAAARGARGARTRRPGAAPSPLRREGSGPGRGLGPAST